MILKHVPGRSQTGEGHAALLRQGSGVKVLDDRVRDKPAASAQTADRLAMSSAAISLTG